MLRRRDRTPVVPPPAFDGFRVAVLVNAEPA